MSEMIVTKTLHTLTAGESLIVNRPHGWPADQPVIVDARGTGGAMTFTLDTQVVIDPVNVFRLIRAPHGVVQITLVTDSIPTIY
jgi:hypothetical protein